MNSLMLGPVASPAGGAFADRVIPTGTAAKPVRDFVLTDRPLRGEAPGAAFRRLAAELMAREAKLLHLMIYGSLSAHREIEEGMRLALGRTDWPVTWIEGPRRDGPALAGVQAFAVTGCPVTRVRVGNRIVGSIFEDCDARHCVLGGVGPTSLGMPPAAQVQQTFANLEWALGLADFRFSDVVRTWFYNDDIVAWYDEFNRVRSRHYAQVPFSTGSLPASTGIGARNRAGAALVMAAWAMQPLDAVAQAREIGSPLQCPAPAYGSSFSRAMELRSGGCRRLFVSGTASIHPDGTTAWLHDAPRQVALTMEVVGAILGSRDMDFRQVTRATAYLRDRRYQCHLDAWLEQHELTRMPVVSLQAEICRDDLLFEIELDAVVTERAW